jgi:hypothetical protein
MDVVQSDHLPLGHTAEEKAQSPALLDILPIARDLSVSVSRVITCN